MLTDEDYALKRRWDLFCHELLEEVSMNTSANLQGSTKFLS